MIETPQLTQKYTVIQLFEDVPEGATFSASNWLLHTTIADTFAINWDVPTLVKKLTELLGSHAQATTIAMGDTFFGDEKQVRVVLLEKTDSLVQLHYDVITLLEQGGLKSNDPQFAKEGFLPHATVQPHARLAEGDRVVFRALSIVDMFPNKDAYQRKVLATIKINDNN